jgi:gramicidin S synthase 2/tyrocidine synthetase-3
MQEGMLYHSLSHSNKETYFEQIGFTLKGNVDVTIFEQSLQILVNRHDILRTNFVYQNIEKPQQVVFQQKAIPVFYRDLSTESDRHEIIKDYEILDRQKGFHLTKDDLMRFAIFQLDKNTIHIIWSFHHILLDGWSWGVVMKELLFIYHAKMSGQAFHLPEPKAYIRFIDWLKEQDQHEALNYWNQYLMDYTERAMLPIKSAPSLQETDFQQIQFHLGEELSDRLNEYAKKNHVTLNTVFRAIWGILVQQYTNQQDILFGTVVSGRSALLEGIESMVGLFINTIPVRITSADHSFLELTNQLHEEYSAAEKYSYCPLYEIQNQTSHKQDLIDHIVVFENYPLDQEVQNILHGKDRFLQMSKMTAFERTNYPITVIVIPDRSIAVKMMYDRSKYDTELICQIESHLKVIAQKVLANPFLSIKEMDLLPENQKEMLQLWNTTNEECPTDKLIHQWFEEQVEKTPDKVAVVCQKDQLTYRQLNKRANQIAQVLRVEGIGPDDRVGLMLERSVDMIVGILAILKSGGAYVPIDLAYPKDRINNMLKNSRAKCVLSQFAVIEKLHGLQMDLPWIDIKEKKYKEYTTRNLLPIQNANHLAYVIYTSGTTGTPKGVMLEHRNLVNLLHYQLHKTDVCFAQNVMQYQSIGFDVSFQEIFTTLLSGGQLHIVPEEIRRDGSALLQMISRHHISVAYFPVALLKHIFEYQENIWPDCLQHLITAGEQLMVTPSLKKFLQTKKVYLHNHYGPSETHVVSTYTVLPESEFLEMPPIGKPIANNQIYILDQNGKQQPIGTLGELYLAGANVGRGYLGNEALTADKFLENPFDRNTKMYRTGDIARWMSDGNIEYHGRVDQQVKIRGHRVELGEIEGTILLYPNITDVTVLAINTSKQSSSLCAYVVSKQPVEENKLKAFIQQMLPSYMVPTYVAQVEQIPTNQNGKVDRMALPKPIISQSKEKPQSELECQLVELWEDVLGVENIGVTDDFFAIGGHSLHAISLMSKMQKTFQAAFTPRLLFQKPTIRQLATHISSKEQDEMPMTILHNSGEKKCIFCFPPITGYGMVFAELARLVDMYTFVGFDFIDEKNQVDLYCDMILKLQKEGPYILLGYSAGGPLAFEVAKMLEQRGFEVSDVIIMDAEPRKKEFIHGEIELQETAQQATDYFTSHVRFHHYFDEVAKKDLAQMITKYLRYWNNLRTTGTIEATIHQIIAENVAKDRVHWTRFSPYSHFYHGKGKHDEMLLEENLVHLVQIVKGILSASAKTAQYSM